MDIPLKSEAKIEFAPGEAVIRNGKISCSIRDINTQRPCMEFFKHEGDKKKRVLGEYDYGVHAHNPGTRIFQGTDQGLFHSELHLQSHKDERFYGMGLNAEAGTLNLKGSVIDLYQRHVKHVVPFSAGEKEVVTICRSSWAGSQRYGAAPAHHDILSSFEHFEEYMRAYLNLSMSGIPWGAAGIGGFVDRDKGARFHELMVRWYQYGVFCPVFRTHGHRGNNEPWNLGGDSYRHVRAAMFPRLVQGCPSNRQWRPGIAGYLPPQGVLHAQTSLGEG